MAKPPGGRLADRRANELRAGVAVGQGGNGDAGRAVADVGDGHGLMGLVAPDADDQARRRGDKVSARFVQRFAATSACATRKRYSQFSGS